MEGALIQDRVWTLFAEFEESETASPIGRRELD